jgi:hypothetical protein
MWTMKKILLGVAFLCILCVVYIIIQLRYIRTTEDMPYRNITDGACMVYFNIEHNGIVYPVTDVGAHVPERLYGRNKLQKMFLAPLYLKEIIKYDWSIHLDDEQFKEFEYLIVDKKLIELYSNRDLLSDTTVMLDNRIRNELAGEHFKAIIYVLLKNGVNCCLDCETGIILISDDD